MILVVPVLCPLLLRPLAVLEPRAPLLRRVVRVVGGVVPIGRHACAAERPRGWVAKGGAASGQRAHVLHTADRIG